MESDNLDYNNPKIQASILLISKNRKSDLEFTLKILKQYVDLSKHEILIFLDGCTDDSEALQDFYPWVKWTVSPMSLGASAARHQLYPKAKGRFLIGLDDDAHPLQSDFIARITRLFDTFPSVGILAFEEIKGVFSSDSKALQAALPEEQFYTNEFIGCGFAIRNDVYHLTNGFPIWIDIYGEESCLSMEVIANGYDVLYSGNIKVNHRVDFALRKRHRHNYFRFEKQLKNTTFYYLVYYRKPMKKILRLYVHNFRKYASTDIKLFRIYIKTAFYCLYSLPRILHYRKPVDKSVMLKYEKLKFLKF